VAGRDAPSARAASLASSAALPHPPGRRPHPAQRQGLDPTSMATSLSTRWGCVPLPAVAGVVCPAQIPLGGMERPRRKVRFAPLIHAARPRCWRTCGPRRLRRQSQPAPVATDGAAV
jgi:hypothetical protein